MDLGSLIEEEEEEAISMADFGRRIVRIWEFMETFENLGIILTLN